MVERTIVLPTANNSGQSLATINRLIRRKLLELAGGYSEIKQVGVWRDAGRDYRDTAYRVVVTCTPDVDALVVAWLPTWTQWLEQQCLYTHSAQVDALFVYRDTASNTAS